MLIMFSRMMTTRRQYRMAARAQAAEATGRRILATATSAFLTRAYDEVSLEDVAKDAGVTVQTVLRRFGSKARLVAAAAKVGAQRVQAQRDLAPVGDVAGAVRTLIDHYEEWGDSVLWMLDQEAHVPPFRKVTTSGRQLHRRWVERTFAPWLRVPRVVRARRLALLVTVTDVYVWKLLRRQQGLSRRATAKTLISLTDLILIMGAS
jgi:AcrR family transcriptional regulator